MALLSFSWATPDSSLCWAWASEGATPLPRGRGWRSPYRGAAARSPDAGRVPLRGEPGRRNTARKEPALHRAPPARDGTSPALLRAKSARWRACSTKGARSAAATYLSHASAACPRVDGLEDKRDRRLLVRAFGTRQSSAPPSPASRQVGHEPGGLVFGPCSIEGEARSAPTRHSSSRTASCLASPRNATASSRASGPSENASSAARRTCAPGIVGR